MPGANSLISNKKQCPKDSSRRPIAEKHEKGRYFEDKKQMKCEVNTQFYKIMF